jgi:hypothetical protein
VTTVLADVTLSSDSRTTAGVLLLTLVAVEYGGVFMLHVVRGRRSATPFQRSFARAGHAHAGVLVILALVGQLLADAAVLDGVDDFLARTGIWVVAVLFPRRVLPVVGRPRQDRAQPPDRSSLCGRRVPHRRGRRTGDRAADGVAPNLHEKENT